MSEGQVRMIPVCGCAEPDPVRGIPFPLCYNCGRVIAPPETLAKAAQAATDSQASTMDSLLPMAPP